VIVLFTASTARTRFRRDSLRMIWPLPCTKRLASSAARGVAPPHRPVLPPWGTTAVRVCAHNCITAATSWVVAGFTTASGTPV
jgi:negative regulator of sigma E activity